MGIGKKKIPGRERIRSGSQLIAGAYTSLASRLTYGVGQ